MFARIIPLAISLSSIAGFSGFAASTPRELAHAVLTDRDGSIAGRLSIKSGSKAGASAFTVVISYDDSVDGIIVEFMDAGICDFEQLQSGGKYVREGTSYELFRRESQFSSEPLITLNHPTRTISVSDDGRMQIYLARDVDFDLLGADKDLFFDDDGTAVTVDIISGNRGYQVCGSLRKRE